MKHRLNSSVLEWHNFWTYCFIAFIETLK